MSNFQKGFEKRASFASNFMNRINRTAKNIADDFKQRPSWYTPPPLVGPSKPPTLASNPGIGGKIRGFLNRQSSKANLGIATVALPGLLYGGYKAIDSAIGTPTVENEW